MKNNKTEHLKRYGVRSGLSEKHCDIINLRRSLAGGIIRPFGLRLHNHYHKINIKLPRRKNKEMN